MSNQINTAIELSSEELDLVAGGSVTDNSGDNGTTTANKPITISSNSTRFVTVG